MEAPEKIYLYSSDRAGEEYENEWGTFPWGEDYVEYIRTDALTEKLIDIINKAAEWWLIHDSYSKDTNNLVNDFKKDLLKYVDTSK